MENRFVDKSKVIQKYKEDMLSRSSELTGFDIRNVPMNVIYMGHEEYHGSDCAIFGYGNMVWVGDLGTRKMILDIAAIPMVQVSKLMKDLKEFECKKEDEDYGIGKDS